MGKKNSHSTEVLELSANSDTIQGDGRSGHWSKSRMVLAAVVGASFVALGLGLGLGLGLNLGNSGTTESPTACQTLYKAKRSANGRLQFKESRADDNSTWVPENCPIPGQATCPAGFSKSKPPLLLLSLDGFRAEYLVRGATPMLKRLSECGLQAPYMRAMFPTKTFPNHYTLVTGLYAESHGIIDNSFYDPVYKENFAYGGRNDSDNRWWGGEPIWNTVTKAGLKAATVMWVGSEVNIQGIRPEICYDYNSSVPLDVRVSEILSFFEGDPQDFPDLVAFYFEQPDSAGHNAGPFGDYVMGNLTYVDGLISDLVRGLTDRGMGDCFNFVIVADHGMSDTACSESIDISRYLDTRNKYTVYTGAHSRLSSQYLLNRDNTNHVPVPVEETLSNLTCLHYNETKDWYARYHAKGDLPKRYHYALHRAIDEIVLDLEGEYSIVNLNGNTCFLSDGNHGYDNTLSSMHAMFIGYGPAFKQNLTIEQFENIELYNLLADLVGVEPAPNNGTYGLLHHLLYDSVETRGQSSTSAKSSSVNVTDCPYPEDIVERETRRNNSDCNCTDWTSITTKTIEQMDEQLNLNFDQSQTVLQNHLPMGIPNSTSDDVTCLLTQTDYVTGYSEVYQMPLWTAFHLTPGQRSILEPGSSRSDKVIDSCHRADVRMTSQADCFAHNNNTQGLEPTLLYPPGFSNGTEYETDSYISSNVVPMYRSFRWGVWREFLQLLEEYAEKYSDLHVLFGPVFDYNIDGLKDSIQDILRHVNGDSLVPLPTHYYAVIARCERGQVTDSDNCFNATSVISFILPHKSQYTECWEKAPRDYLRRHTARVKDVELLTGLTLFPDIETSDPVSSRRLRTHLSEHLWPALGWADAAAEGQCPTVTEQKCPSGYTKPPVILISLDGFRPDYLTRGLSPTLEALRNCGVTARYMNPTYPSMTFPNHHTISTGLYPESHGITDNSMYDLDLGESFYLGSPTSTKPEWWQGEPIWTTLVLQNKTAMTYFWPGSEVPFEGIYPTKYFPYNGAVPYTVRIDTALGWLNNTELIPDLVVLYLSKVDSSGHDEGPNSPKVDEAIATVDESLKRLMDGLYRMKLHTCVNIIIVSDHGMSDIACQERSYLITDKLPEEYRNLTYVYTGSNGRISNKYWRSGNNYFPVAEEDQVPESNLTEALACQFQNLVAMETKQIPVRYHYAKSPRTDDVQLLMADSWLVGYTSPPYCSIKGQHGWDPYYENMKAIFVGYGPAFESNKVVEPFNNIELYNLMTHLTGVQSSPNNGTEGSLYHLLRTPPNITAILLPESDYEDCQFPQTDAEYSERASANQQCGCNVQEDEIKTLDDRLHLNSAEMDSIRSTHCGIIGVPMLQNSTNTGTCILHHTDYVSGYNKDLRIPLWSSFLLTDEQVSDSNPGADDAVLGCNRTDVRLESVDQISCLERNPEDLIHIQLFPNGWSSDANTSSETLLNTNSVPMIPQFYQVIWSRMLYNISEWVKSNSDLQIILGPAFDHNADVLRDENITTIEGTNQTLPSHYYVIVSRCSWANDTCPGVDTLSFLLPHRALNKAESCMTFSEYLLLNTARVRDIELLTGLEFFSASHLDRQMAIVSRTFYHDRLWA